jgi:glucosamine-6-phosphate deaminase
VHGLAADKWKLGGIAESEVVQSARVNLKGERRNVAMEATKARLIVLEDEDAVGTAAAEEIAGQVRRKPESALLLPTGRTPLTMYRHLVSLVLAADLDLGQARVFNLDEFWGLPLRHPGSYRSYLRRTLLDQVPIPPSHVHLLDSAAQDPAAEGLRYEEAIRSVGGIDLAVLGIGVNGHIAFNEPGSDFASQTRLVSLQEETLAGNAYLFDNHIEAVPHEGLTVGIATIMNARKILLLATGSTKVAAVETALHGPVTTALPASVLQNHSAVTLLLDRAAAGSIKAAGKDEPTP